MDEFCILGIDTSNYKTSVAVVTESGKILCNFQEFLTVKKGNRGLRQSEAFFQHVIKLPDLIQKAFNASEGKRISAVSVSTKPRPVEGSYMPVFNAGKSAAEIISTACKVPLYTFSHQEGHIEAVRHQSEFRNNDDFISFHFSGGTTEALHVKQNHIKLVGGSKDLAMGQVLDRLGVTMGMNFPCGEEMDRKIENYASPGENRLTKIKVKNCEMNLSGIETQCQRLYGSVPDADLIYMVFERLSQAVEDMCINLEKSYGVKDFLFAGGVSSSRFMRSHLKEKLKEYRLCFGNPALSTDNAVGIAFLGGNRLWQ